jgi:hypothetical protein
MTHVTDKLSLDQLVDGVIDAYVDWRVACDQVDEAYRCWTLETSSADDAAFGLYMAALDAEEDAAASYAANVRRAYTRLWGKGPSAEPFGGRAPGVGQP